MGRSLEDWEPQVGSLCRAGYRVLAPDLPGSGFRPPAGRHFVRFEERCWRPLMQWEKPGSCT
ncbi:alpha/beta fold hydrolase [Mycobacterium tilburgii]|uniref:hypothetical protein n=1 Tax=Mycobacterium tilburgii TaxID=44467 RepID=UPI00389953BA